MDTVYVLRKVTRYSDGYSTDMVCVTQTKAEADIRAKNLKDEISYGEITELPFIEETPGPEIEPVPKDDSQLREPSG